MRPVLCMITNGQHASDLPDRVRAAADSGAHLVQLRERDLDGGALLALAVECRHALIGTSTRLIVNDRLDVALAASADGVHLRADSVHASAVRRFAPAGFLVGRSVHSEQDAVEAVREGGLDYLLFGTVFESASKPGRAPAGIAALERVAASVPLPVLAVGGVTKDRIPEVLRTGAAGVAGISLFAAGPVPAAGVGH